MEAPVFRLEGIVKAKGEASDFEGPLALILSLLAKDKVEIRDISISLILEQYLQYLDAMAAMDLDIASEFVAMASHLTYIKTKMLLSGGTEVTELEQLISSLEELHRGDLYLQVKAAAEALSGMYRRDGTLMEKPPEYLPPLTGYRYEHSGGDLLKAIYGLIGRENTLLGSLNPRQAVYPHRIVFSIPDKIAEILERLKRCGSMSAKELFYESGSRAELVATLVAVLELCRVGGVLLTGVQDDTTITYVSSGRSPSLVVAAAMSGGEGLD